MTRQERQEAEAQVYGLTRTPMTPGQFSSEDIERMRAFLAQHDAASGKGPGVIKEFDLNNPPKEPYRFQEFPKLVYDHDELKHKVVRNPKEEKAALAEGWQLEAYPRDQVEQPTVEERADAAEIERLDKLAREKKTAKG